MLRLCVEALFVIVTFVLQSTLFQAISLASIAPNAIIMLVSVYGFIRGKKSGMFIGFFSGLLVDIFYGDIIGFYALLYMVVGYLNGFFHARYCKEEIFLPMGLVIGSDILYGIMVYVLRFALRNRSSFVYNFVHVIIPETIYTLVITIILYRVILVINRKVEEIEKRSASKFD